MASTGGQTSAGRPQIEDALSRLFRQAQFAASPKMRNFLRFVVEETLAGRQHRIKAFTIAGAVYGRDESFDPQTNSLVRVEALRLRTMLDTYYTGVGAVDPVKIRIPRGAYVPVFIFDTPVQPDNDNASGTTANVQSHRRRTALAAIAAIAVMAAATLLGPRYGLTLQSVAADFLSPSTTSLAIAAPAQMTPTVHN